MRVSQLSSFLIFVALGAQAKKETFELIKGGPSILTPRDLVHLPRLSTSLPSPDGLHLLSSVSEQSGSTLFLSSLESNSTSDPIPVTKGASSFLWLSATSFSYVDSKTNSLLVVTVVSPTILSSPKTLVTFPVPVGDLKYHSDSKTIAFTAEVWDDGLLSTVVDQDEAYEKRGDKGQVFDSLFVRHWDTWRGKKSSQIFLLQLQQSGEVFKASPSIQNPLNSTNLASPSPDALSDFDLSSTHLVVSAKDPHVNPAWHTRKGIYLLGRHGGVKTLTSGTRGATSSPKFSPDGKQIAWLSMNEDGYEADKNNIILYDIASGSKHVLAKHWDRSPSSITWFPNSSHLLLTTPHLAREVLFTLPVSPKNPSSSVHPTVLYSNHSSGSPHILPSSTSSSLKGKTSWTIVFSRSSLTEAPETYVLEEKNGAVEVERVTRFTEKGLKGKNLHPGEEFWFEGSEGATIQGWAVLPPGFKKGEKKKWPMAFLIHGGPQGAWEDSWSSRWNPNVFAQQGYVVIAINPHGSTSFGQKLTDGIKSNWGSRPIQDLLAGLQHALKIYPEVDDERLAALGASWGGYAVNWLNGHNDAFGFKAFVCHDGIFSTLDAFYTTDELYFIEREFGNSVPWENRALYEKWNPANHVASWTTPQLVIHGGKDYRLGESHGLAAFTALQRQGVPSRFLYFEKENHWVLNGGNSLRWHHEIFKWLDEWVGEDAKDVATVRKEREQERVELLKLQK